ncbi:MurR/RpiR family transcriptional regulator [Streptomyces sp. MK5]|uniref:MurR/RpiR family transcriptional regulator n=1 Tax=Streptomyces sp. MK5 TaxID=3064253 RepID=UPI002741C224|nr:MurR/RpiR family transcriptional regulator [Streptomyces sp. MK5]
MTPAVRKLPTLQERVTARYESLTPTERKVATYLCEHPQQAAFSSAEEIATATGTSDASVVRTAKSLGFDGLPGLKRTLQEHLGTLLTPTHLLHNTISNFSEGPEGVVGSLLAERADLLNELGRTLDPADFRRAVELVADAHETLVWGLGGDASLVEYTVTRLNRLGYRARPASDTGFQLVDRLLPLGPDDVVLIIAQNRIRPELEVTLQHAADTGASTVLLTDTLREALDERTDAVLTAPTGRPEMYGGQSMFLIVLEALTLAVAARDEERAIRTFDKRNQLRELLDARFAARAHEAGGTRKQGRRRT